MATATLQREAPLAQAGTPHTSVAARQKIRRGEHSGPTSGLAPGFVQANLAILPQRLAEDFLRFCQLNPKPCPLIGVSAAGDWRVPALGADLDIRSDLPRYRVWRDGAIVDEPGTIAILVGDGTPAPVVIARSGDVDFDAAGWMKQAAASLGGRGGGRPELAQGGLGASPERVLEYARDTLRGDRAGDRVIE